MTSTKLDPQLQDRSDEISLSDIIVPIWRKRVVLFIVAALTFALAVTYAMLRPERVKVKTVVELGSISESQNAPRLVEPADIVQLKIGEAYAIRAEQQMRDAAPEKTLPPFEVSTRAARNSNIVVYESVIPADRLEDYREFHALIYRNLHDDHARIFSQLKASLESKRQTEQAELTRLKEAAQVSSERSQLETELASLGNQEAALTDERIFNAERTELENEIAAAEKALSDLRDAEKVIVQTIEQQDISAQKHKERIEQLKAYLNEARAHRSKAVSEATQSTEAMLVLMLDADYQRTEAELHALERKLGVEMPVERTKLAYELHANRRQQPIQDRIIAKTKADLEKTVIEREQKLTLVKSSAQRIRAKLIELDNERNRSISVQAAKISDLDTQLSNVLVTRLLSEPHRDSRYAPLSRSLIIALGAGAALALGLIAAAISVVVGHVRASVLARA